MSGKVRPCNLALHRIVRIIASTLTFDYSRGGDLVRFDADGRFGCGKGETVRVTFRIDKDAGFHIIESPLSKDQIVVEHEDCYEISATVVDSAMLEWWVSGFGDQIWGVERSGVVRAILMASPDSPGS